MKRIVVLFIIPLFCAALLTACQETPQADVVVSKSADPSVQEMLQSVPVPFVPCEAPAHIFRQGFERNGVTVNLDAEVIVPEVSGYAVALMERRRLDDETILGWARYFAGNGTLIEKPGKTKSDYIRQLLEAHDILNSSPPTTDPEIIAGYEQEIADLQEKIKNAPDTGAAIPLDLENYETGKGIQFSVANGRGAFQTVRGGQYFTYWRNPDEGLYPESFYPQSAILVEDDDRRWKAYLDEDFAYPKEEAIALADETLYDLGLTELSLSAFEKCCVIKDKELISKAWTLTYTRDNRGLLAYRQLSSVIFDSIPAVVGGPWEVERVSFVIDETGIRIFDAAGLSKETIILMENVELLSFEEIVARAEALLRQMYVVIDGSSTVEIALDVRKIELRSALISVKDDMEHGLCVPVWLFTFLNTDIDGDGLALKDTMYLTLDAHNGGYIEPQWLTSDLGY